MGKQLMVDEDVFKALITKALDEDLAKALVMWGLESGRFSSSEFDLNGVMREFLRLDSKIADSNNNYPRSKDGNIQGLLDGLKDTIFSISKDGMVFHEKSRRWVANPNIVTITVQDARAKNIRITVYGRPNDFASMRDALKLEDDMASFSRFLINSTDQLPLAIKVIEHSYELKKERGRL
jgi:hypothetical protein